MIVQTLVYLVKLAYRMQVQHYTTCRLTEICLFVKLLSAISPMRLCFVCNELFARTESKGM